MRVWKICWWWYDDDDDDDSIDNNNDDDSDNDGDDYDVVDDYVDIFLLSARGWCSELSDCHCQWYWWLEQQKCLLQEETQCDQERSTKQVKN